MRDEVAARIDWRSKGSLRPWHLATLLVLPPEGARPSDLAGRSGLSRQAVSQWVRELGSDGYLDVAGDVSDGRARIVRPTTSSMETVAEASRGIDEVEAAWGVELGGDRLEQLRSALRDLRDRGTSG